MAVNLTAISAELLPGLATLTGMYKQLPRVWNDFYDTRKSKMQLERNVSMRYMSVAAITTDGESTPFDNGGGQRYVYNQTHLQFQLAFAITRQTIEDNLYSSQFGPNAMGLRDAFLRAEHIYASNPFNTATTYDSQVGGDGVALGSASHPVDGGTVSNIASPAASLNETALLNAQVAINANWRDNANQRMDAKPECLIIPPQLEAVAVRLLKTELRPGTANNDVNAILSVQGGIPKGYKVWNYLTSQYAWFILTDQEGLLHYNRIPYSTDMSVDFTTDTLLVKGRMRQSWSYTDFRSIYVSAATS